jgi:RNA polymerase sigma-54 factor
MLKQTQSQKLVQKVLPQIIQKQNLLAVPTLTLEQMVRVELDVNPFLEEELETPETDENIENNEFSDEKESEAEESIKTDEEYDWDDFQQGEDDGYKTSSSDDEDKKSIQELYWKSKTTFYEYLISQLHLSELNEKQIFIGEIIIGNINNDGYLLEDLEELLQDINKNKGGTDYENTEFNTNEIKYVLSEIQKFEPPGVAANNLKESLLIQLGLLKIDNNVRELSKKVLSDYFDEFRLKNYEKISKELEIDIELTNLIFEIISKLNPKPASAYEEGDQSGYIYPDLIVTENEGEYIIELNEKYSPRIKLNSSYKKLLKDKSSKLDNNAIAFINNNYERAKWFLEAIESRRNTMLSVMDAILKRQKEFFDNKGETTLKPLYEKEIAEDINMSISTISRAVKGKYVQTDFGIYELKEFFSKNFKPEGNADISINEIEKKLKEIIEIEDSSKPFNDEELVIELNKFGYNLARRTVAKYRENLGIQKARLRRKL